MRLIDADKLELKHYIQRVSDKVIGYNGTQPKYANYDILAYDIANAPTVKAIPIEWIKKKKVDFQNKDYPFNYCRGMQDGFNDCIDYLLSEWEKESRKGEEEK